MSNHVTLSPNNNLRKKSEDDIPWYNPEMIQDNAAESQKKLLRACTVSITLICIELVGGIIANSLAIVSDAVHVMIDVVGFLLAAWAVS